MKKLNKQMVAVLLAVLILLSGQASAFASSFAGAVSNVIESIQATVAETTGNTEATEATEATETTETTEATETTETAETTQTAEATEPEQEDPCKCCENCTDKPGCQCFCGKCMFCIVLPTKEMKHTASGVKLYSEKFPAGTKLVVEDANVNSRLAKFGVPANKKVFGLDISLRTAQNRDKQPEEPVVVKIPVDAPAKTKIGILHTHEGKTSFMGVTEVRSDGTVEFSTDSFSEFVGFTVDFHYNGEDYSIPGMSSILLSELFSIMKIKEDASKATSVIFSDPSLIKVTQQTNDWLLTSLQAFDTEETLIITFSDGHTIVIDVTDEQYMGKPDSYHKYRLFADHSDFYIQYNSTSKAGGSAHIRFHYYNEGHTSELKNDVGTHYWALTSGDGLAQATTFTNTGKTQWFHIYSTSKVYMNEENRMAYQMGLSAILTKGDVYFSAHSTAINWTQSSGATINPNSLCSVSIEPRVGDDIENRNIAVYYNGVKAGQATVVFPIKNDTADGYDERNALLVSQQNSSRYALQTHTVNFSGYGNQTLAYTYDYGTKTYRLDFYDYKYQLTYDTNGGNTPSWSDTAGPKAATSHTFTVTGTKPTRDGYEFLGWADSSTATSAQYVSGNTITVNGVKSTNGTTATATKTIYAVWKKINYTVSFNVNGATSGAIATQTRTFGESFTLPTPSRTYTVSYDNDANGTADSSVSVSYTFDGWEDRGAIVYKDVAYDAASFDGPYYANTYGDLYNAFQYNKYSLISHYVNNGKGEGRSPVGSSRSYYYSSRLTVSNLASTAVDVPLTAHWTANSTTLPNLTKTGYKFEGWYSNAALTTKVGNGGASYTPTANVTLYAKWTPETYTVTVSKGTGISAVSGGGTYEYGASVTINATVDTGYTWLNWTGTSTQTARSYTFTMPASNVTFTANATPNTNTPYVVKHYQQNLENDNYTEVTADRQNLTGTTGAWVTPAVKTYTGFTSPGTQTVTILGDGSRVVEYYYIRNSYKVTVQAGTGISAVSGGGTYKYGQTVIIGATVETGYVWKNWTGYSTQTTQKYTFTMPAAKVDYTANAIPAPNTPYVVKHYQQNLADNNYTEVTADRQNLTGTTGAEVTPAVKTYTGFTSPATQTVTILADGSTVVEYYYTRNSYTVTVQAGTGISAVSGGGTYKYGQTVIIGATVETGYVWKNWTGYSTQTAQSYGFTMPAANVTYTANGDRAPGTVTYKYTGTVPAGAPALPAETTHSYMDVVTVAAAPKLNGYTFSGWTTSNATVSDGQFTMPLEAVIFEGTWTANTYTATVAYGNGEANAAITYTIESTIPLPTPSRTGYTFNSWTVTEADGNWTSGGAYTGNTPTGQYGNVTFTAQWDIVNYNIQYDLNGGSVEEENPDSYNVNSEFTLNTPQKTGYLFDGWVGSNGDEAESSVTIEKGSVEDKTYVAQWTPISYTVRFNGNGATSGTMADQAFVYDAAQSLRPNAFEKKYTVTFQANGGATPLDSTDVYAKFSGWTTLARMALGYEDEEVVNNLTTIHEDEITLFADWTPGSAQLPEPTLENYNFTGWYTAAQGGQRVGGAGDYYSPEEDVTLYAQWAQAVFTITFDTNGGSQISPMTLRMGETVPAVTPPVKKNARFIGWSPEIPATMPNQNITVVAQWEYAETLTISVNGNSNETFLFSVEGKESGVNMVVSVRGGGSVTIGGLYSDTYDVTELSGWSWTRRSTASTTVVIADDDGITENQAKFTKPVIKTWWLFGEACK